MKPAETSSNISDHKSIDATFLEIEFYIIALINRLNLTRTTDEVFRLIFDDFMKKMDYPSTIFS